MSAGPGRVRRLGVGRFYAVLHFGGARYAHRVATRSAAESWLERRHGELAAGVEPLPVVQLADARAALALLRPGETLLEVVRVATAGRRSPGVPVSVAVERFLQDKGAAGLRPRSLYQLRYLLGRLAAGFGDRGVDAVRSSDLVPLLAQVGASGVARNNLRRAWVGFWRWCIAAGLAASNPAAALTRAAEERKRPGILAPDEAGALLGAALQLRRGRVDLVPFFALGLFAGLRTAEVCRLGWSGVDLGRRLLRVEAREAKGRVGRLVSMVDPLPAWLDLCARSGPVLPFSESTRSRALVRIHAAAGVEPPPNALRHSFASYRVAALGDAGRTATELGHGSADMLHRHYRELVTPSDAAAFFALSPAAVLRRFCGVAGA